VSAHDSECSPLSQLERARRETLKADDELWETKRVLGLLGLEIGGIDRALSAIALTRVHIRAAFNIVSDIAPETRGARCA